MNNLTNTPLQSDFKLQEYSVLVVDDNPVNLAVIVDYLEDSGLNTLVSQDGESSLKRAKYAKPGIILLDIMMPGIDGYETCRLLKKDPETKHIPVIFMTALSRTEDKVEGFKAGAVDFVTKPIHPEEVIARIELHLKLHHITLARDRQNSLLAKEIKQKTLIQDKLRQLNQHLESEISDRLDAQASLNKLNESLERRVEQRTVLLAQSNQKLKQEISERERTEVKLKDSLIEKEILLKEIYHRVKNNLLVVSSILELQANYVDDPELVKMFNNSQERIYSMALVHEQLYRSDNLQEIDLGLYIKALIAKISESHSNQAKKIELIVDAQSVHLNLETVNSCGLIINELVTNALEHAFLGRQQGKIWLNLLITDNKQIRLTIKDNGVGLPEKFDFQQADSLGLKLVRILTRQLEGELKIDYCQGTCFQITFGELDYGDRLES